MKKVAEIFGLPKAEGNLGVEVEVEGENLKALIPTLNCPWKTENDGSLRGMFPTQAAEFVLYKPLVLEKAVDAVKYLSGVQKDATLKFSFRTSVHVHVNTTDMTGAQALSFIYVSLLLEELLMKFCGEERIGNRFCLRIQDAEGMIDTLSKVFEQGVEQLGGIPAELIRYSAINIASLPKYGSVEFRGMRGTLDIKVLTTWLTALDNIRKYSHTKSSPLDVYEEYAVTPYNEFVKNVLGDVYQEFLYPGFEGDIARSFSLTLDLPNYYHLVNTVKEVKGKKADFIIIDDMEPIADVPPLNQWRAAPVQGIADRPAGARPIARQAVNPAPRVRVR